MLVFSCNINRANFYLVWIQCRSWRRHEIVKIKIIKVKVSWEFSSFWRWIGGERGKFDSWHVNSSARVQLRLCCLDENFQICKKFSSFSFLVGNECFTLKCKTRQQTKGKAEKILIYHNMNELRTQNLLAQNFERRRVCLMQFSMQI